jgi:hypothetical protein
MSTEYTFSPDHKDQAILLAARIAAEGQESTVHCGTSHFGGSPSMDFIEEYVDGIMVQRHHYRQTLTENGWVFGGMAA